MSLFQRLAENLIFDILAYFLPECKLSTRKPQLFPWFLGHICSRWRTTFLSSPQFWSKFTIDLTCLLFFPQNASPNVQRMLVERAETFVKICTERSHEYPLIFDFDSLPSQAQQYRKSSSCHRMLEMLLSKSAYWKDVRLCLSSSDLEPLYKAKARFPQLVSLDISVYNDVVPTPLADLFMSAPCLSRVCVDNPSTWNLDWASITTIKIDSLWFSRPEEFRQILQQTKVLEKLVLVQPFPPCERLDHIKPITLPFLRILRSDSAVFLPFIQAPALEYLWVELIRYRFYKSNLSERGPPKAHVTAFFGSIQHLKYMMLASKRDMKGAPILVQNIPRVDHMCLVTDDPDMLHLPGSCRSTRLLRQISISSMGNEFYVDQIIDEMATWKRKNRGSRAAFPSLESVFLDVPLERPLERHSIISLKKRFDKQDIQLLVRAVKSTPGRRPFSEMCLNHYLDVFQL